MFLFFGRVCLFAFHMGKLSDYYVFCWYFLGKVEKILFRLIMGISFISLEGMRQLRSSVTLVLIFPSACDVAVQLLIFAESAYVTVFMAVYR
jgi:hypothetical protein